MRRQLRQWRYGGNTDRGTLTKLDISNNSICAGGAKILAEALNANQAMTELNLSGNYLGRQMPANLSELSDMSGVDTLADVIPGMGALTKLDARSNYIDDEGNDRLKKAAGSRYARLKFLSCYRDLKPLSPVPLRAQDRASARLVPLTPPHRPL
jgi:hypothetical protein